MISKRHCALIQRDGKAYIRDFGSTNGTFLNDQPVKDEVELHHNDELKIGPLLFEVQIWSRSRRPQRRPRPSRPTKAVRRQAGDRRPGQGAPGRRAAVPRPRDRGQEGRRPAPAEEDAAATGDADDDIAAMLLSLQDDDGSPSASADGAVPEGSTVMDLVMSPKEGERPEQGRRTRARRKTRPSRRATLPTPPSPSWNST